MPKIEKYTVTDTRKAAQAVKGKAYRFREVDGQLLPRDPAFPLATGPAFIEKGRAKKEQIAKVVKEVRK
jgi:hypothetical protein